MTNARKHILILSSWYPNPEQPFLGNFVQRHAELLSKAHDVTVLNTYSADKEELFSNTSAFTEISSTYVKDGNLIRRKKAQDRAFNIGLEELKNIDLIIAHVGLPRGLQFVAAKKKLNCPLIYIEHGSYFREQSRHGWSFLERLILKRLAKHSTKIIAVSDFLRADMQKVFPKRSIEVIGNSVDSELFTEKKKTAHDKIRFLHISTLDPETKNTRGIIEACEKLKNRGLDFKLTIVSDEPYDHLADVVNEKDLSETVHFIGPLNWEALVPIYHDADCFVLFSNYETFSIVLVEALLTGTPIISTPVGVTKDLDSDDFIEVQTQNTGSLADAMQDFIMEMYSFEPQKLRAKGLNYSNESILNKWKQIIDELG